jgi:hypothetical protein
MGEALQPLPPNKIPGLNPDQANEAVETANRINVLRDFVDDQNPVLAEAAQIEHGERYNHMDTILDIGQTALLGRGNAELLIYGQRNYRKPVKHMDREAALEDTTPAPKRRGPQYVINPADGRQVPYGSMRRGDHPYGGHLLERR